MPSVDPGNWIHDLPELGNIARITLEDFRPPADRAERETFEDMRTVAERLNELAGDPDVDGVVTLREMSRRQAPTGSRRSGEWIGAIGFADPDRVVFYREPTRRHTMTSEFAGSDFKSLPPVEIFYAYTEAPGYPIDATVEHGVKGIVVDGSEQVWRRHRRLKRSSVRKAKGVVVVMTARVHGGRVQETISRTESKIVSGDNLLRKKPAFCFRWR